MNLKETLSAASSFKQVNDFNSIVRQGSIAVRLVKATGLILAFCSTVFPRGLPIETKAQPHSAWTTSYANQDLLTAYDAFQVY